MTISGSSTFLIWTFPQMGISLCRRCVKHAQRTAYCVSGASWLFRARDANSRIVNYTRSMDPRWSHDGAGRGDSKSERLRKRKAVTPHRPAKRPRLFQADQQETELRQHRTFRKWRQKLAVYYANSHGSCVNSAKSA